MFRLRTRASVLTIAAAGAFSLTLAPTAATAATTIDGPIDLGTAEAFSVLAASTVTNSGLSVLDGDVGLSPGTSITGFPPGIVNGVIHATNTVSAQGRADLTSAYNVAASLTPTQSGLGDLAGTSLTPGTYAGDELSVTGALTLDGTADSVWIFQAASTLTIGAGAIVTVTGTASACNVFWQVGSSATIGSGAQFVGTVLADISVTAQTTASVTGRLLARTGAVTLDTTAVTVPSGCTTAPGTVTTTAEITSSAPPAGVVGTAYGYTVTASGGPGVTFSVIAGTLPPGLTLDPATGVISGQPTATGTYPVTISAANGTAPADSADYEITVAAGSPAGETLVASGPEIGMVPLAAGAAILLGLTLSLATRSRRSSASFASRTRVR